MEFPRELRQPIPSELFTPDVRKRFDYMEAKLQEQTRVLEEAEAEFGRIQSLPETDFASLDDKRIGLEKLISRDVLAHRLNDTFNYDFSNGDGVETGTVYLGADNGLRPLPGHEEQRDKINTIRRSVEFEELRTRSSVIRRRTESLYKEVLSLLQATREKASHQASVEWGQRKELDGNS